MASIRRFKQLWVCRSRGTLIKWWIKSPTRAVSKNNWWPIKMAMMKAWGPQTGHKLLSASMTRVNTNSTRSETTRSSSSRIWRSRLEMALDLLLWGHVACLIMRIGRWSKSSCQSSQSQKFWAMKGLTTKIIILMRMSKFKIMILGWENLEMITKVRIILLDTIFSIQSLRTSQILMKFQDFWSKERDLMNQFTKDYSNKISWQKRLPRRQNKMSAQDLVLTALSPEQNQGHNLRSKNHLRSHLRPLG